MLYFMLYYMLYYNNIHVEGELTSCQSYNNFHPEGLSHNIIYLRAVIVYNARNCVQQRSLLKTTDRLKWCAIKQI